jgi:hypothetical protein
MLDPDELRGLTIVLLSRLWATRPDCVVLEVADGIFQRETAMLLRSPEFRSLVDHVFFAANDSLSAESGVRHLREHGLPPRAVSGLVTRSPLGMREAEAVTGVPCLSPDQIAGGAALQLLRVPHLLAARARHAAPSALVVAEPLTNGAAGREKLVQLVP